MIGLGDAIHQAFTNRDWTEDERQSIEDVLDAALAADRGELPIGEALKIGALPDGGKNGTPAFARVRAVLASHPRDPRRAALLRLMDIVIGAQPGVMTNHGFFFHSDLAGTDIVIHGPRNAA